MSQTPSVGRDVHYISYGTPGGEYESVCRAAKITEVHGPDASGDVVSLCVFNPEGLFFNKRVPQGDIGGTGGTWHWPERVPAVSEAADAADPGHPEKKCWRCEGPNIIWTAPSPLWNQVMRSGDINNGEPYNGIVCPRCFAVLAEEAGIADRWRLTAERVHVPLQTTTPSGRVWNPETWMFEKPEVPNVEAV